MSGQDGLYGSSHRAEGDNGDKDLETFANIGALTDEWEDQHQALSHDIEKERMQLRTVPGEEQSERPAPWTMSSEQPQNGTADEDNRFDASQYAFFGEPGGADDVELGGQEDDGALEEAALNSLDMLGSHSRSMRESPSGTSGLPSMDSLAGAFGKLATDVGEGPEQGHRVPSPSMGPQNGGAMHPEAGHGGYMPTGNTMPEDPHGAAPLPWGFRVLSPTTVAGQHHLQQQQEATAQALFNARGWGGEALHAPQHQMHGLAGQAAGRPLPRMPLNALSLEELEASMAGRYGVGSGAALSLEELEASMAGRYGVGSSAATSADPNQEMGWAQRAMAAGQQGQQQQQQQQQQQWVGERQPGGWDPGFGRAPSPAHMQERMRPPAQAMPNYGGGLQRGPNGRYRSKYMSTEEIESLMRIQWNATHANDPYLEDYYHLALQARAAAMAGGQGVHFAPNGLRDLPLPSGKGGGGAADTPVFLPVEGLGRVALSNIRRPRQLLELEKAQAPQPGPGMAMGGNMQQLRPLEQEPMLAARLAIEDGVAILQDVEDADRLLAASAGHMPDGGAGIRRQRQQLLEGLAQLLQLLHDGQGGTPGPKDDLVFLRLVSLPKGRKLVTRYIQLIPRGSGLQRVVVLAIMRHLRFLFGVLNTEPANQAASAQLARVVALAASTMDLPTLSACLAAVVISTEQPPLRPMGAPAGDGATVILQMVLDTATRLRTPPASGAVPMQHQVMWQASFDAFFHLLSSYCSNKFDTIVHSVTLSAPGNATAAVAAAASAAMQREMPVEILRACLPHTDEKQRQRLLDFTQRSMKLGLHPGGAGGGIPSLAAVRG